MLEIQKALFSGTTPDELQEKLGIRYHLHSCLPLIGFSYHQIDSPKANPIVREARGLLLELDSWKLVAKGFNRFFNLGEIEEEYKRFNWNDFTCYTKADGSLMLLYYYDGNWHVKTRGSFAEGVVPFPIPGNSPTFADLFWDILAVDFEKLDSNYTYVFEMCSTLNKVVRIYSEPTLFLLSVFDNVAGKELLEEEISIQAEITGLERPEKHHFSSLTAIQSFLKEKEEKDPSFEGVVVRDSNNLRYKIKSATYLALHHMHDNGGLYLPKRLVPFALKEDPSELLTYFPEAKPYLDAVVSKVDSAWHTLLKTWEDSWHIKSQKEFALAIKDRTPFGGLLFMLRKQCGSPNPTGGFLPGKQKEAQLKALWRNNPEIIVKMLFKN